MRVSFERVPVRPDMPRHGRSKNRKNFLEAAAPSAHGVPVGRKESGSEGSTARVLRTDETNDPRTMPLIGRAGVFRARRPLETISFGVLSHIPVTSERSEPIHNPDGIDPVGRTGEKRHFPPPLLPRPKNPGKTDGQTCMVMSRIVSNTQKPDSVSCPP